MDTSNMTTKRISFPLVAEHFIILWLEVYKLKWRWYNQAFFKHLYLMDREMDVVVKKKV
jgi:hypothetical protein